MSCLLPSLALLARCCCFAATSFAMQVSQEDFATFEFKVADSGSDGCVLKIVNKKHKLPSGELAHYFKISSVSVLSDPGLHCERGEAGVPLPCTRRDSEASISA